MSDEESIKPKLKLRAVALDTYRENVAYMHRECSVYRAEGFRALAKIRVGCDGKRIEAVLNAVDDARNVAPERLLPLTKVSYPACRIAGRASRIHYPRITKHEP
jgi:thymidine phosphorylase